VYARDDFLKIIGAHYEFFAAIAIALRNTKK